MESCRPLTANENLWILKSGHSLNVRSTMSPRGGVVVTWLEDNLVMVAMTIDKGYITNV